MMKIADDFYLSKPWRRMRGLALDRDGYVCQDCLKAFLAGRPLLDGVQPATMVHHIIPREEAPELELELSNLISLCDGCHNRRHPEKHSSPSKKIAESRIRVIKI